ncbi:hypothetical protein BC829DRAFT_414372 [Chytridium lagenaria]|nr:hypothetical protein BC829DRAFT_414372 [Chytridium lagenaria]
MSLAEKNANIEYWRPHLPAITKKTSKNNVRATIILGVIGAESLQIRLCKDVAESLFVLLNEDGITLQRISKRDFTDWAFNPHGGITGKGRSLGHRPYTDSRQAIVQIASLNTPLFLSTITFDFSHAKASSERIGGLKLLGMFISKRLANGTSDGAVVVYDLKTATRIQILEGHQKPVAAVAFSADGRLIATFSLEENSVRLWQTSASFFNSLVGALSGNANTNVTTVGGVGHMKSFRQFSVGLPETAALDSIISHVRFEWISERSVRLHSIRETQLVFTV